MSLNLATALHCDQAAYLGSSQPTTVFSSLFLPCRCRGHSPGCQLARPASRYLNLRSHLASIHTGTRSLHETFEFIAWLLFFATNLTSCLSPTASLDTSPPILLIPACLSLEEGCYMVGTVSFSVGGQNC